MLRSILSLLIIPGALLAAPLVDEPVAELRLKNNKLYRQAIAKSFTQTGIFIRHSEGGATVKYEDLPDEIATAVATKRPSQAKPPAYVIPSAPATPKQSLPAEPSLKFEPPPALTPQSGKEAVISGQVFVTTNASGNIKLGGVRVSIYSAADYNALSSWSRQNHGKAMAVYHSRADVFSAAGQHDDALFELKKASVVIHGATNDFPKSTFSTTTDADGRFTVKHRIEGGFVVVAYAQRAIGEKTEHYQWAIASHTIEEPSNLLLHNANME